MSANNKRNEFKDAVALGHIKPMPELPEQPQIEEQTAEVIDDPETFRVAVAHAQMEGADHVFVSEKMLKFLLRGHPGVSLTYGSPGVRVYLAGTKDDLDRKERLSAEAYHEEYMREMRGQALERQRVK